MEEVAARAGVSKGTVFLYFPSKVELFKAVVRENISGRFERWNSQFSSYEGTSGQLLERAVLAWWERIGATRASGISKLVLSEGSNFPEIAAFFQQEVVQPGHELLGRIVERGIRRGEFRPVNVPHVVRGLISIMVLLALSRHCSLIGSSDEQRPDPVTYLREQVDLITRGLAAAPSPSERQG